MLETNNFIVTNNVENNSKIGSYRYYIDERLKKFLSEEHPELNPEQIMKDGLQDFANSIPRDLTLEKIKEYDDSIKNINNDWFHNNNLFTPELEEYIDLKIVCKTSEKVLEMIDLKKKGGLVEFLNNQIAQERKIISGIIESEEAQKELFEIKDEISKILSENEIIPPQQGNPNYQFVGPTEELIYGFVGETNTAGSYDSRMNFIVVKISEEEIKNKSLSAARKSTFAHEYWHYISGEPIDQNIQFKNPIYSKSGFLVEDAEEGFNKEQTKLNEGSTELLARMTVDRLGLYEHKKYGDHPYDQYVAMMLGIHKVIAGEVSLEIIDDQNYAKVKPEIVKLILEDYIGKDGILNFGRRLEKEIGKYANLVFEYFSKINDYDRLMEFLSAAKIYKDTGKLPEKNLYFLNFNNFSLDYDVSEEEFKKTYPFFDGLYVLPWTKKYREL